MQIEMFDLLLFFVGINVDQDPDTIARTARNIDLPHANKRRVYPPQLSGGHGGKLRVQALGRRKERGSDILGRELIGFDQLLQQLLGRR